MSTRSCIGIIDKETQEVTTIYVHFDGYPSGNGQILLDHYQDPEKVKQLIELGNLSSLGREIGEKVEFNGFFSDPEADHSRQCLAYGRDRGEEDEGSRTESLQEYADEEDVWIEWTYLFDGESWYYTCMDGGRRIGRVPLLPLTQKDIDRDKEGDLKEWLLKKHRVKPAQHILK